MLIKNFVLFSSCLRSWLENDTSCPTCRQSLASDLQPEQEEERQPRGMAAFMMGRGLRRNHFFHFDGKFNNKPDGVDCCKICWHEVQSIQWSCDFGTLGILNFPLSRT